MPFPRVGVNVVVKKDGKIIALLRRSQRAWALPGGHLEKGESIETCAQREVLEETGVSIACVHVLGFSNDQHTAEGNHYLHVWTEADWIAGEIINKEPERCLDVQWVTWDNFPEPIFLPVIFLRKNLLYPQQPAYVPFEKSVRN